MERIDLCGSWQGRGQNASGTEEITFTGTVPGCVHTDLMPEHVAPDLYWRDRRIRHNGLKNGTGAIPKFFRRSE